MTMTNRSTGDMLDILWLFPEKQFGKQRMSAQSSCNVYVSPKLSNILLVHGKLIMFFEFPPL